MSDRSLEIQSAQSLIKSLELPGVESELPQQFDDLRRILIDGISYLVEKNPEKLKWVLYRIDVSIEKIADLIIGRQLEKMKTREGYSNDETNDDEERW
ncbi:MAG: hypothetical protein IH946_01350 [Bacteroidetes bacterium]|nr:hypothetical protein [Bacteroidota bacterium]